MPESREVSFCSHKRVIKISICLIKGSQSFRMKKNKTLKWALLIGVSLFIGACSINRSLSSDTTKKLATSDHYRDGKYS